MNDSHFTFKLQGVNTSAFVGNDAVTNMLLYLLFSFVANKKLSSRQLTKVIQSTSYKNNRKSFDKNLNIEEESFFGESSRTTVKQKFS